MIIGIGFNDAKFQKTVKKATIYIARVGVEGNVKDSGPCIDCLNTLKFVGIKKMVFTTNNETLEMHDVNSYTRSYKTSGNVHLHKKKQYCIVS